MIFDNGLYQLQLIISMQILYVCKYKHYWVNVSDQTALTRKTITERQFLPINFYVFHSFWIFLQLNYLRFSWTFYNETVESLKFCVLLRKLMETEFLARLKKAERKIVNGFPQKHPAYKTLTLANKHYVYFNFC